MNDTLNNIIKVLNYNIEYLLIILKYIENLKILRVLKILKILKIFKKTINKKYNYKN